MKQSTYNALKSFIWGIANDCLVDVYDVGDYRKVILPMLVIRRFDAVLEPTHDAVVEAKKKFVADGITVDIDPALCGIANQAFVNKSDFTLRDLKSRTNQQQLRKDFIDYLDGFSKNVQEIINKFHFREQISRLSEQDRLGLLIEKFVDPSINLSNKPVLNEDSTEKLEALDNHTMGTLFEEVIRMFNEQTNVTDAGRHFTPRDIIELMADLAFIPIQDKIQSTTYRIYDGACGTGGMLTVGESCIKQLAERRGKKVSINLFGQENFDETYAIACADMLLKGEGTQADNIFFGSTISNDGFPKEEFDFMLSNPPFGTSWKAELKAWGDIKKDEITDSRFIIDYDGDPEFTLLPDIGDPQMLFLANNISKMKQKTSLGSRIVEVHNESSLSTGRAGNGSSNLRRYIIENDLLEAIIALPENMFYNTPIGTFLWIVTNKKDAERKGKVQLIDATAMWRNLRKNIGDKSREITPEIRKQIIDCYLAFEQADSEISRIIPNEEFGYYSADIMRPLRLRVNLSQSNIESLQNADKELCRVVKAYAENCETDMVFDYNSFYKRIAAIATEMSVKLTAKRKKVLRDCLTEVDDKAEPVVASGGDYEVNKDLKDTIQIPLLYEGGLDGFLEDEIKPFVSDAWIDKDNVKIGYSISFTKYFYNPEKLRNVGDILEDLGNSHRASSDLLQTIYNGANAQSISSKVRLKDSGNQWLGMIPEHWELVQLWQICSEQRVINKENQESNVLSLSHGNIIRKKNINFGLVPKDYVGYQIVEPGNIILRLTDLQNDQKSLRTALVKERGIITSAYVCLKTTQNPRFIQLILHVYDVNKYFYGLGGGVRQSIGFQEMKTMLIPVPPIEEQEKIAQFVDTRCMSIGTVIDEMIENLRQEIAFLGQYKTQMATDIITGRTDPDIVESTELDEDTTLEETVDEEVDE